MERESRMVETAPAEQVSDDQLRLVDWHWFDYSWPTEGFLSLMLIVFNRRI
jgi:hypothetical protein